ncbi:MAG TPA: energy transducer TonB [Candidatus Methylomirabilis sp.]|nr:energy transducer TonB [Candidatus Methylomirabilis sp.]
MTAAVGRLEAPGPTPREVWLTLGLSVLFHGVLVGTIVLIPHFRVGTYLTVPVSYTVSLVSTPPGGRSGAGQTASPPPPAVLRPAPLAPPPQAAPAPPAARPTEELTLPGRQAARKPAKEVEPSLRPPIAPRQETTRPAPPSPAPPAAVPVAPAAPVPAPPPPVAAQPAPPAASTGSGAGADAGKESGVELAGKGGPAAGGTALAAYLTQVDWKIQSNWVPVPVAGAAEVIVVVRFRVLRSGQVRDVDLDVSSGNGSVDTSALRAIRQSMPLPPFPNLLMEPYLDLRYRFVMERG